MTAKKTAATPPRKRAAKTTQAKRPTKRPPTAAPSPETAPADEAASKLTATVRGESFAVDAAIVNDFELIDDLVGISQAGGATAEVLASVARRILTDPSDRRRLYDMVRDRTTGRPPLRETSELVMELMEAVNPN